MHMENNKSLTRSISLSAIISALIPAILLVMLLFYLSAIEEKRVETANTIKDHYRIEQGASLYEYNCRSCHGMRGEGVGQLGPSLSDEKYFTTRLEEVGWTSSLYEYTRMSIESGRMMGTRPFYAGNGSTSVMPPWHKKYGGSFDTYQITALCSFIMNWKASATNQIKLHRLEIQEESPNNPKTIAKGKSLFLKNCGTCHSYRRLTSPTGEAPDLSDIASFAHTRKASLSGEEYIIESVTIPDSYIPVEFSSTQSSCGALLSKSELSAVSTFLLQ